MRAIERAQRYAQTGRGRSQTTKRRSKKRKASPSVTERKATKRSTTSPQDIFG